MKQTRYISLVAKRSIQESPLPFRREPPLCSILGSSAEKGGVEGRERGPSSNPCGTLVNGGSKGIEIDRLHKDINLETLSWKVVSLLCCSISQTQLF